MKFRHLAIFMTALLVSCSASSDKDEPEEPETDPVSLKVMSFNILSSVPPETGDRTWIARREPCIRMLGELAPDIIGFQEPRKEQIDYLIEQLPDYGYVEINLNTTPTSMYNLIMYRTDRFKLLDSGHFWLSATPEVASVSWGSSQYRGTVWAKLSEEKSGKSVFFFNTHLDHISAEARLEGSKLNVIRMSEIAGRNETVILTGDMNASNAEGDERAPQLAPYYDWMQSARETAADSDMKISFQDFDKSAQRERWNIDHIFFRRLMPLHYRVVDSSDYGVEYLSDHWPIYLSATF